MNGQQEAFLILLLLVGAVAITLLVWTAAVYQAHREQEEAHSHE